MEALASLHRHFNCFKPDILAITLLALEGLLMIYLERIHPNK